MEITSLKNRIKICLCLTVHAVKSQNPSAYIDHPFSVFIEYHNTDKIAILFGKNLVHF